MVNELELKKVKNEAIKNHIPIIMDDSLEVIKDIIEKENPKKILEIGTAVGYSASMFAIYAKEAIVDTIELDVERAEEAKVNISNIGLKDRINIIIGNAVEILPNMDDKYDFIFIDANKGKYPVFLQEALRLSHKGSVIIADNILYKGYVMSDYNLHKQRTAVRHLREYIKDSTENENLDTKIIEVGDGLAISYVK